MYNIVRYSPSMESRWDEFVKESRNSCLLFLRKYMDYHADRFTDHSLLGFKGERLIALLPANENGSILHSHQGLTFGGWVLPPRHVDTVDLSALFGALLDYCRKHNFSTIDYKPSPVIYHRQPSSEDIYCLHELKAEPTGCNISEAIRIEDNPGLNTLRRRHLRKAEASGFVIRESTREISLVPEFHAILTSCLAQRHNARPIHTVGELGLLHSRFPDNIRIFLIYPDSLKKKESEPVAGTCVYEWHGVAHCQYIATTPEGREGNYLTPLFNHLISNVYSHCRFFDFGTSNNPDGSTNEGLLRQKASFGASGIVYQRFSIKV